MIFVKILYMSWFSSGEGSKIHAQEFTHAMEQLGHQVITKDLSINKSKSKSSGKPANTSNQQQGSSLKNYIKEYKSILMVILRFLRLFGYMVKYKPERIIYRYSIYDISGLWISKLFRVPVVYEINGSVEYEREIENKFYFKKLVRRTEKSIFNKADLVLLVSNELKRYFNEKNYNMNKILIVPNGVDMAKFNREIELPAEFAQMKEQWADKKVIGFSGSLKSWHGAERIIDILPDILKEVPDARYLIIGDGDRRRMIEAKMKEMGLEEYVYITGFQDYKLIPTLLKIPDITVAPYHNIDFFHFSPLKVIEYMGAGKPVVAPPLGQCVDLIGYEGDRGILLSENTDEQLTNAIVKLLKDPALVKTMGRNAQSFIEENYTWEQNARRIDEAIQKYTVERELGD